MIKCPGGNAFLGGVVNNDFSGINGHREEVDQNHFAAAHFCPVANAGDGNAVHLQAG